MCKIMAVAGIKQPHLPKVYKLAKAMSKEMSRVEDDGVGYAAITSDGQIYGEKWLNKDEAFVLHKKPEADPIVDMIVNRFGNSVDWDKPPGISNRYMDFGNRTQVNINNTVGLILHARKATNGAKTLENVHPFVKNGGDGEPISTALIHNGSILNHDKLTKQMSSCDSEVILHEYMGNMMYHNPWGIEQLAKTLVGTYTVGVLSSQLIDENWVPYLDIFKSNKELSAAYIPEIETMVFTTMIFSLETAAKDCEMTVTNVIKFKDGYLHRLNAITGEIMEKPISFSTSSQYMNGYNRQHENSSVRTIRDVNANKSSASARSAYGPYATPALAMGDSSVGSAKRHFERKHPELFTVPYLEGEITVEEQKFFDELEKDKQTDHKALRLVSAALNMRGVS